MRVLSVDEVIESLRVHEKRLQERESREEEHVLRARAFNQSKKGIVDHPQEEEEEDLTKEEEEVMDVEDSPRMIKMKRRENHLTSQRLSVTIVRRWVTLPMNVIQIIRRKVKKKRQISQKKPKKSRR